MRLFLETFNHCDLCSGSYSSFVFQRWFSRPSSNMYAYVLIETIFHFQSEAHTNERQQ